MNKRIQNIVLTLMMVASVPLAISGDTYQFGLLLLGGSVVTSLTVLFIIDQKKNGKIGPISWLASSFWSGIIFSFLLMVMGFNIFGDGLVGLSNWANMSVVLGLAGIATTSIQLFRVNK